MSHTKEPKYFGKLKISDLIFLFMIAFLLLMILSGIVGQINGWFNAPNDNPYEELAEEVIKAATGIEVDLTPNDDL